MILKGVEINLSYSKGSILRYNFPEKITKNKEASKILKGSRMCVILHKRETPYNTVLIAPITRLVSLKSRQNPPINYVELKKDDYPIALTDDCYINLDMTTVVDESDLNAEIKQGVFKVTCPLKNPELYKLDLGLTKTFEMERFLNTEKAVEIRTIVEYINHLNENSIMPILASQDENRMQKVSEMLNNLTKDIEKEYISKPNTYTHIIKSSS